VAASPAEIVSEPAIALDREWRLILAACSASPEKKKDRIRESLADPIEWKDVWRLADTHGVEPLLFQALSETKDFVPGEGVHRMEQDFRANLHRVLFLARELVRILDHLSAIGVDAMPYKGLAVADALYGDIALRQTGDIDLLIRAEDLPRIRQAVRELGYSPHISYEDAHEGEYLKSGYELAFDGTAGPNLLELQWAILPRFYAVDFDMPGLFKRSVAIDVAGHRLRTPGCEDSLLALSAHAAKHLWSRLIWLCDIARLMAVPSLNWEWIISEADTLGMKRILWVSLILANQLLDAPLPELTKSHIENDGQAAILAGEIRPHIAGEAYNVESLAYFRLMLRLRERRADQLIFLSRLIFTPGPGEWESVRLPRMFWPLYRVVRLARLAGRLIGA
jgi:hypothetical protein